MRVYTNDPYIKRRARIGQIVSWAGLAVLAVGLFITIRTSPGVFLRFSNDPTSLTREVSRNRNAIAFLDFAALALAENPVRVLAVDGVVPSEETIASGEYPLVDAASAAAIIVNPQNTWIDENGVSQAELAQLFSTENSRWLDVKEGWPNAVMARLSLPQEGNAAFAIMVDQVMEPAFGARSEELLWRTGDGGAGTRRSRHEDSGPGWRERDVASQGDPVGAAAGPCGWHRPGRRGG